MDSRQEDEKPDSGDNPFPWPLLAALLVALLFLGYGSFRGYRAALALPPDQIGAASYGVGLFGLGVTVLGFGFTFWQLARTRRATAAVTQTIKRIKRDFGSFDILLEVRTARAAAAETQGHIQGGRWDLALVSYNNLRSSLATMLAVRGGLTGSDAEQAKDHVADALDACKLLDSLDAEGAPAVDRSTLNNKLRELDGFLIHLEYSVKDSFSGSQ